VADLKRHLFPKKELEVMVVIDLRSATGGYSRTQSLYEDMVAVNIDLFQ
jgi:hypothetical protein